MSNTEIFLADTLVTLFDAAFMQDYHTRLIAGANEPQYEPATANAPARLHFRHDYFRSALHEIAHWCVAGDERRQQPDFGYWYAPEGRTTEQQILFMRLEVLPQAYEWLFCAAAGCPFDVSLDDFSDASQRRLQEFRRAVYCHVGALSWSALPLRVRCWCEVLARHYRGTMDWDQRWINEVVEFEVPG